MRVYFLPLRKNQEKKKTQRNGREGHSIGLFSKMFGQKSRPLPQPQVKRKKRAVAFVDYEHWYISLEKLYNQKPDVKQFRDELAERYEIIDIAFFGDFSNPALRSELQKIRAVSNTIIETQNASSLYQKDFTDFIMLDHIYQRAISSDAGDIDAFIIFSGDGHFSSVVSFLVTKCRREVGIYAVKNAISAQLASCASYLRSIPDENSGFQKSKNEISKIILLNLKKLFEKNRKKKIYPTFWATVEAVAKYNRLDKDLVAEELRKLISKGYIYQIKENVQDDTVKVLKVNWNLVYRDKLL